MPDYVLTIHQYRGIWAVDTDPVLKERLEKEGCEMIEIDGADLDKEDDREDE